ncbi:MAG TPA: MFS transporter [Dehalococcoidia bacterium]
MNAGATRRAAQAGNLAAAVAWLVADRSGEPPSTPEEEMEIASKRENLILALTCLAQFMVILDFAIVNVALPSIQRDLDLSQSTLQSVVIAYGLLLGGFFLLGGRLGDLLGRRRILLVGLALF